MNEFSQKIPDTPDTRQVLQLKELIAEMVKCCEDRRLYEHGRFGLPYAEVRCLMLFAGERYLTPKDIARRMDVAKSRVTRIILGMEKKGLVQCVGDPADARVTLIRLTPAGKNKMEEINNFQRSLHEKILLQFSEEERVRLLQQMKQLGCAMKAIKETMEADSGSTER